MKKIPLVLLVFALASCRGTDYLIRGRAEQDINPQQAKFVVIKCDCEKGVIVKESKDDLIHLKIKAKQGSKGYHGRQPNRPGKISKERMLFKTEFHNDTLKLLSQDHWFMHHFFLIDKLKVEMPKGVNYDIVKE